MTIEKSFEWLFKRFKSPQIKPCKFDFDCLTYLAEFANSVTNDRVENDNRLFAKLLVIDLKRRYLQNNENINDAIKSLSIDLKFPLDYHIELLSNKITSTQITNYVKTLTIDVPEDEYSDPIALAKREDEFWNTHQKNILDEILFLNSKEQIKKQFFSTANEILNNEFYRK